MTREELCKDCCYLVEGDNGEWICDCDGTDIHDVEDCDQWYGVSIDVMLDGLENPRMSLKGDVFDVMIDFLNENREDETVFTVDCSKPEWKEKIKELWDDFRKENNLDNEFIVTEVWCTFPDMEYPCGDPNNPDRLCFDCEYDHHCNGY